MRTVGDKVHSHNSNCIYSVAKSNRDSIEFSLSNADKGAVGLIPALELASLTQFRLRLQSRPLLAATQRRKIAPSGLLQQIPVSGGTEL